jgi:uncharacterized protein (DUF433 family)
MPIDYGVFSDYVKTVKSWKAPFMSSKVVTSLSEVIENINAYQDALRYNAKIRDRISKVWSWYAIKDEKSDVWKFGPGKFIGYSDPRPERYLKESSRSGDFDGRITERVLAKWFTIPEPGSRRERELVDALREFLAGYGKVAGARARINVPVEEVELSTRPAQNADNLLTRISSNPEICGGRPCIKGTRMRVADLVEALAQGASQQELLADFDYLTAEDISAALLYAARATEHRVVRTA